MRTISEFHYSTVILDGTMFKSYEPLHAELALPDWHGRNFDVLLDCLERDDRARTCALVGNVIPASKW